MFVGEVCGVRSFGVVDVTPLPINNLRFKIFYSVLFSFRDILIVLYSLHIILEFLARKKLIYVKIMKILTIFSFSFT